jgi:glucose/arabinose dehydrogenase
VVVTGLVGPTQLQFDTRGRLFVLEGSPAAPRSLRVFDRELRPELTLPLGVGDESTGLLVLGAGETVFVATRGRVDRLTGFDRSMPSAPEPWIDGLPNGLHTNNGLALGPDGLVYFGVGSTCDFCEQSDPRSAAILRADPREARPTPDVFARGVRNPYDLAFTPRGELVATDNSSECDGHGSPRGGELPDCRPDSPDRFVVAREHADLGWPDAYRGRGRPVDGVLSELPAHGGATGFCLESRADAGLAAYVTLWGSQHGGSERGRRVMRVELERGADGGLHAGPATPWLGPEGIGHPIDVTPGPDGALYVLDFDGRVLRLVSAPERGPRPLAEDAGGRAP